MYKITDYLIEELKKSQVEDFLIEELSKHKGFENENDDVFISDLVDEIGERLILENRQLILKYSNPEEASFEENDDKTLPPSDIVAYNESRSCADLIRLYDLGNGKLKIQPDFQRDIVWDKAAQSRFIDSLTKQLPIPSLCFSLDYRNQERLVIDGLQRMQSIINFLTMDSWKISTLEDIDSRLSGKQVSEIKKNSPELIEIVENVTLPITVLRCDNSKVSHNNYLFTIFHRLNSGGKKLNNQEIRNCIYQGKLNDFIKKSTKYNNWRLLLNLKANESYRFKYEELILRFFAFYDELDTYNGRLAKFLNSYMHTHKNIPDKEINNKRQVFEKTIDLIYDKIADKKQLKTSITIIEALIYGVAKNIDKLEFADVKEVKRLFNTLLKNKTFSLENLQSSLSDKDKVLERLSLSEKVFSS